MNRGASVSLEWWAGWWWGWRPAEPEGPEKDVHAELQDMCCAGVLGWRWGRGRAALPHVCQCREEETLTRVKLIFWVGVGQREEERES